MSSQGQADAAKDDLYKLMGTATVLLKDSPEKQEYVLAKIDEYIEHWNYWAQNENVSTQQHRALRIFPLIEAEMAKPAAQVTPISPEKKAAIAKAMKDTGNILANAATLKQVEEVQEKNPVLANKYKAAQTELVQAKQQAALGGQETSGPNTTPEVKKAEEKVRIIEKEIEKEVGKMPWWGWVLLAVGLTGGVGGAIAAAVAISRRR